MNWRENVINEKKGEKTKRQWNWGRDRMKDIGIEEICEKWKENISILEDKCKFYKRNIS